MSCSPDELRHDSGLWRTFMFIGINQESDRNKVTANLNYSLNKKFSYQIYSSNPTLNESEHISYRVYFNDLKDVEGFRKYLKNEKISYKEIGYDEEGWVKEAYVVGTKMFLEYLMNTNFKKAYSYPEGMRGYLRIALHGFFNNMGFTKGQEYELLKWISDSFLREFGFKV